MKTASIGYIPGVKTTNWSSDFDNPKNSYNSEYFIVNYAHEGVIVVSKDKFIRPRINENLRLNDIKYYKNNDVSLTFNDRAGGNDLMVITNKGKFIYIPTK